MHLERKLISSSFLSSKDIIRDLKRLDDTDVDYIHLDVMDGKFVPKKTMPFSEMKHIYKYTSKRLDIHLMVKDVERYIKDYATLNAEYITIHVELSEDIEEYLQLIKSYGIKSGLAISPTTKIKELIPYLPLLDIILVMSVTPGEGGQEFILETKDKLKELRILLNKYKQKAVIAVDGGINDETKKYCVDADILVAGSYVILPENEDFQEKINKLRAE